MCLEELTKTTKNFNRYSRSPDQDFNLRIRNGVYKLKQQTFMRTNNAIYPQKQAV